MGSAFKSLDSCVCSSLCLLRAIFYVASLSVASLSVASLSVVSNLLCFKRLKGFSTVWVKLQLSELQPEGKLGQFGGYWA